MNYSFRTRLAAGLCLTLIAAPALAGPDENLFQALENQNFAGVQQAIQQHADPNAVDATGVSVIARAIETGKLPWVEWLFAHGAQLPRAADDLDQIRYNLYLSENPALMKLVFAHGLDPQAGNPVLGSYLRDAARAGKLELLAYLLKLGMQPNWALRDDDEEFSLAKYGEAGNPRPLLHHAIDAGQLKSLQLLLRYRADINQPDAHGDTPLMYALAHDKPQIAGYLLSQKPNLSLANQAGDTALYLALMQGQPQWVKPLLAAGAPPLCENQLGETPLDAAVRLYAKTRQAGAMQAILARLPAAAKSQALGHSLIRAAGRGEALAVDWLLQQGAPLNATLADGGTALMQAAASGNVALVQTLLKRGLNPETSDQWGRTALFYAVAQGRLATYKSLVAAGARTDIVGQAGLTLLMEAARNGRPELLETLLAAGAPLEQRDAEGRTALLWACSAPLNEEDGEQRRAQSVQSLLAHHADPAAEDKQGRTALLLAAEQLPNHGFCGASFATVAQLAKLPLRLDARDAQGRTALMLVVQADDGDEVLATLLARGSDPNLQDADGNSALHHLLQLSCQVEPEYGRVSYASVNSEGYAHKIQLLLRAGANPDLRNHAGESPLSLQPRLLSYA